MILHARYVTNSCLLQLLLRVCMQDGAHADIPQTNHSRHCLPMAVTLPWTAASGLMLAWGTAALACMVFRIS